jgi:peptidoglycan hydrolase-like protein with peptidoglycan-binding domain
MHEWHLIRENGKISQRVFPIVMPGADITVKSKYKEYYAFFNQRKQELVEQLAEGIIPLSNSETEAAHFGYYLNDLAALYQYLADYNTAKHVVRENDYAALISQLKSYIGSKSGVEIKPQATNNKRESVYNGLTTHQCQLMQMNLNSTREALLEDEKNNKNSSAAKDFLKSFSAPIETDGIYDESTKNAVIALQTYLSLKIGFTEFITIDGIYGPETEGYYDRWAKKANPNADKKVLDK